MTKILKSNHAVVIGRAITKFGDHAWDIAVPIALTKMNPGSLAEVAAYYLATTLSVLLCAPRLSQWFNKSHRLQNVMVAIAMQAIGILTVTYFLYKAGHGKTSWELLLPIIVGGIIAKVGANLSDISLASDWVPTIFHRSTLAKVNSQIRRADMLMEVIAPVIAGFLLIMPTGFNFIAIVNIFTFIAEAILLTIVFKNESVLQRGSDEGGDDSLIKEPRRNFIKSFKLASGQYVFPLLITNACLWFTVLTPHGSLLTAYLKEAILLPESTLGIVRGLGALVGVLPTFIYEPLSKKLGIVKLAAYAITFQITCLMVSLFALAPSSINLFLGAIIISRLGLYGFTLAELEILQRTVPNKIRLEVAGIRSSINYSSNLVLYASALFLSQTSQFPILCWASVIVIFIGTLITWRRYMVPGSKEIQEMLS